MRASLIQYYLGHPLYHLLSFAGMFSKLKPCETSPKGMLSHRRPLTMGHIGDIIHTHETYLRVAAD